MAQKQPTATAFTRTQESWATFVLDKVDEKIDLREAWLNDNGVPEDQWAEDPELLELYEESLFYERYAEEMRTQRDYIRTRYLEGIE